ncbi:SMC-Scp complex subunit ScpB [Thermophilibacter sp. ET337]|uniref:SMC-Scp complex subunit ScpB n=1 Tax=Thermophilibacter sp. ET337 TaxID=2973084 RepID=UPI0021AD3019|nr:SMC-Scp complex subunit ScpB [Thermophilibacter sp. ET337]MCR8908749.1 SMC-Scp complex subunit ScpB [Thermophilibacter sp. ET337]
MTDLDRLDSGSLKGLLEALLLVSDDAVSAPDLARACDATPGEVASALAELSAEYADAERGFQLREVAGGWRLFTHPAHHDRVADYVMSWDTRRLSQAALETLAVIAYHQPVTREGVRAIRGVNSDGVIASLREKGLVREVGRASDRGQAQLWGTTRLFLEHFGLRSIRELPPLEDFAPDEESRRFIRERLSGRSVGPLIEEEDAPGLDAEASLKAEVEASPEAEAEVETWAQAEVETFADAEVKAAEKDGEAHE